MGEKIQIFSERAGWASDETARELAWVANHLGIKATWKSRHHPFMSSGHRYFTSPDLALRYGKIGAGKYSFDYFHGVPENDSKYAIRLEKLAKQHNRVRFIRTTHEETTRTMHDYGLGDKVVQIPLGVDLNRFHPNFGQTRGSLRSILEIPEGAFAIGSFQKDGIGWGAGNEPKLEKGPDIFLETITTLWPIVPNLHVVLAGPARGYVKSGLISAGVPFTDYGMTTPDLISKLYRALDVYLVSSRYEGGPRAILESMASGVPVVSTMVGQAPEVLGESMAHLLSSRFNPQALAEIILTYLVPNHRKQRPQIYIDRAREFSLGALAHKWLQIIG